jgi:hypothetical protein
MKKPRHSPYPMPADEREELAREFEQFGYGETDDPDEADRRSCTSRRSCTTATIYRGLARFATEKRRRPRGRYTLRQGIRVLERWPPDRD